MTNTPFRLPENVRKAIIESHKSIRIYFMPCRDITEQFEVVLGSHFSISKLGDTPESALLNLEAELVRRGNENS